MKRKSNTYFILAAALFLLFILFTVLVLCCDVQPIGPEQSTVGFATLNHAVFHRLGVHLIWYAITDWLGVAALLFAFGFATTGLCQLIKRKRIQKVDHRILALGAVYLLMAVFYLLFELVIVNYRPILLSNSPEASYPSSHTMIVVCIMTTAAMQVHALFPSKKRLCLATDLVAGLIASITTIGRLISGVHWFTDIVGGLLLASALVALYYALVTRMDEHGISLS